MPDLKKIQSLFQRAITGHDTAFLSQIEEGGKISPHRRLHIYQHAYKSRLRGVLEEVYPVMRRMLGDDVFYGLCDRYSAAHLSSHPSLRYFGQYLDEFVANELPYKKQQILSEMVRFEKIFQDVFDAVDKPNITVDEVAALPDSVWGTLRFECNPSCHIAPYDWNVGAVWTSVREKWDEPILPKKMPQTTHIIQWRRDLRSYFRTLDYDEVEALSLVQDGEDFSEICECLAVIHGAHAPMRAAELLKKWILEGLVSSLDYLVLE